MQKDWLEGYQLASAMNFKFPLINSISLKVVVPNASPQAIDIMSEMLRWNPSKRPTVSQTLKYPYFQSTPAISSHNHLQTTLSSDKSHHHRSATISLNSLRQEAHSMAEQSARHSENNDKPLSYKSSRSSTEVTEIHGRRDNDLENNDKLSDTRNSLAKDNENHPRPNDASLNGGQIQNVSAKDRYLARSRYVVGQNTNTRLSMFRSNSKFV